MAEFFEVEDSRPFRPRRHGGSESEYCFRRNLLVFPRVKEGSARSASVHEAYHFFEHCCTPFGFFRDELKETEHTLVRTFLERTPQVGIPIYNWYRDHRDDLDIEASESLENLVCPWSASRYLLSVLDGQQLNVVRSATEEKAARALRMVETEPPIENAVVPPEVTVNNPTAPASPNITHIDRDNDNETTNHAFGGLQLSEGIAGCAEGLPLVFMSEASLDYLLAVEALVEILECEFPSYDALTATYLTLADLALQTPLGRVYGTLRNESSTWPDVHPGLRFLRIVECFSRHETWIEDLADGETLATSIAAKLNWPSPSRFLATGANTAEERFARHREACEIRQSNYMAFYDSTAFAESRNAEVHDFFNRHMPMTTHPELGTICEFTSPEASSPLHQIRDSYYAAFCCHVMSGSDTREFLCLPSDLRYDIYFDNISNEADFRALFEDKYPWAHRSRFEVL